MKLTPHIELRRFDCKLELDVQLDPVRRQDIVVRVEGRVLDRDSGRTESLNLRQHIALYAWEKSPEEYRAQMVRRALLEALTHELDECLYVDGVRVFDPHKDEPR